MIASLKLSRVGIVGYGAYVPSSRIRVEEIADSYQANGSYVSKNLGIVQKSVACWDEDAATMAYMAGLRALNMAKIDPKLVGAIYVGSESHPYAVKPTSTIVGEALKVGNEYLAADLEFACKAGTSGVQIVASQIAAQIISYGLAIGADKAQSKPGDVLEYSAASGAAAILLGKKNQIARLIGLYSYTSDTADFWRRSEERYPKHAGRFTGEPAYFRHVIEATKGFFKQTRTTAQDWDQVVFHMPNGKFPKKVSELLGFAQEQLSLGFIVSQIGNPYSASSLIGLCRILDQCESGSKILVVSYGSGAGSDVLAFETTPRLIEARSKFPRWYEKETRQLTYGVYRTMVD
jgi:hydroxymethylglutaryl-CoA synthase